MVSVVTSCSWLRTFKECVIRAEEATAGSVSGRGKNWFLMLEKGKFSAIFFLRFQPVISTMREDAWGDFGNTVITGRLPVKFISQGGDGVGASDFCGGRCVQCFFLDFYQVRNYTDQCSKK